AQRQRPAAG
ncbi:transposase, partial [Mycobacterium tuberculosis MD17904]